MPIVEGVPSFLNGPLRPTCVNSARHHLPPPEDTSEISKQAETTKTFDKKRLVQSYGMGCGTRNSFSLVLQEIWPGGSGCTGGAPNVIAPGFSLDLSDART
jgi:hypothetical protein